MGMNERNNYGIRYPRKIQRAINRKSCLWRKRKDNPGDFKVETSYRNAEERRRTLIHNFELKLESDVIENNILGSFNKFINKCLSCRKGMSIAEELWRIRH